MVWDDATELPQGRDEPIELVGTNLRLTGVIALGRFARLSDLVNASSGYIRVRDARLLLRNGEPTALALDELMVDQDEISFIAQGRAQAPEPGAGNDFVGFGDEAMNRTAREFVLFTPGHTVTGLVHVFGQSDVAGFVDATSPRFVAVTDVRTKSLVDQRIASTYEFVLINRTQMIAAAEIRRAGDVAAEGVPDL